MGLVGEGGGDGERNRGREGDGGRKSRGSEAISWGICEESKRKDCSVSFCFEDVFLYRRITALCMVDHDLQLKMWQISASKVLPTMPKNINRK